VVAGPAPLLPPDRPGLEISPREVLLSALKPADEGPGIVLRLLNPTDATVTARIHLGLPVATATPVRLDETPDGPPLTVVDGIVSLEVPPHGLRSLLLG
jgi:alpha-mannosidase